MVRTAQQVDAVLSQTLCEEVDARLIVEIGVDAAQVVEEAVSHQIALVHVRWQPPVELPMARTMPVEKAWP